MKRNQVEAIFNDYLDAYRTDNKLKWMNLFACDVYFADPVGKPPHIGLPAMSAFWDEAHSMGMTLRPGNPQRIVCCGDEAILIFTMHVRAADGKGFDLTVVDNFEFDAEGKVTKLRAFWDKTSMVAV